MAVRYPLLYNPILEYWNEIESGQVIVCRKIYQWYKYLVLMINNPGEYFYSVKRANHVIEFVQGSASDCREEKR